MADEKADFYHHKATTLRRVAETVRFSETRNQLLDLATLFERLGSRLRSREQERHAAD